MRERLISSPKNVQSASMKKLTPQLTKQKYRAPNEWASLEDATTVRKRKEEDEAPDSNFFILIRQKPPAPRESKFTVLGTAAEVFAIRSTNNPVPRRLEEWLDDYRVQYAMGKIGAEVMDEKQALHDQLLQSYLEQTDATIDWYLAHFFRIFDEVFEHELDRR